jgi:hypothetical protein
VIYEHKRTKERIQPVPGGLEADRLAASDDWAEAPAETPAAGEPRVANAHGTARIKLGGGTK